MPVEGSLPGAPDPGDIAKKNIVEKERKHNMYFSAVGFINDVKTGPFWEHSPMLFDISGVRTGWGKINKGMVKMYNGEVLSKFPVSKPFNCISFNFQAVNLCTKFIAGRSAFPIWVSFQLGTRPECNCSL